MFSGEMDEAHKKLLMQKVSSMNTTTLAVCVLGFVLGVALAMLQAQDKEV